MSRIESLRQCMLATWDNTCHPFYQLGFRPSQKTREMEDWVARIYFEVLDGNLKLEDYQTACRDLARAFEEASNVAKEQSSGEAVRVGEVCAGGNGEHDARGVQDGFSFEGDKGR